MIYREHPPNPHKLYTSIFTDSKLPCVKSEKRWYVKYCMESWCARAPVCVRERSFYSYYVQHSACTSCNTVRNATQLTKMTSASTSIYLWSASHALPVFDSSTPLIWKQRSRCDWRSSEPAVVAPAPKEEKSVSCPLLPLWEPARPPLD